LGGKSPIGSNHPSARLGYRHQLLNRLVERMAFGDDLIDDAWRDLAKKNRG
jgi:hypothetical protein